MATKRFSRGKLTTALRELGDTVRIVPEAERALVVMSSGIDALDVATGVRGYPLGRVVIHHGPAASGKTSAALHACAEFQAQGGVALYLDFERKLDFAYADALDVDVDALVYPRASVDSIEAGFAVIEKVIAKVREVAEVPVLIVWDSLQSAAAMSDSIGAKRGFEETGYGNEAHAYSRCLRKIIPLIHDTRALLMLISQVRMDLGSPVSGAQTIGVGKAPLFYATQCFIWKQVAGYGKLAARVRGEADRIGQVTEIEVRKNQVAPPFVKVQVPVVFGSGVDRAGSLLEAALALGRAEKSGKKTSSWFSIDGGEEKPIRVQGIGGLRKLLNADPERFERIRAHILSPAEEPADE